ncbi:MAG TPA: TadE/TadG family type IV pilus assembly protein [Bryobacteraceae bacterium]|jgi:Flp pilus assembly protein TadG|nr:TadE/TadG family type IV pilus assembly protein [Bryobacteraceae bacterium]
MKERSKVRRGERGHAMLELAISAAVMVAFLGGTFQFGYTFYAYNQLVTAVGNGGRYASTRTYRAATPEDLEKGNAAIRNMVVFGNPQPAPGAVPVLKGLTTDQVEVRWVQADGKNGPDAPTAVSVSIKSYTVEALFKNFTFQGRPSVEFPHVGRPQAAEKAQ